MINKVSAGEYGALEIPYGSQAGVIRDFLLTDGGPDCYAIYGYLYDKPKDWDVYENDVMKNIKDLSRKRYQAAVRFLKKHGFWMTEQARANGGTFGSYEVFFDAFPEHFLTESSDSTLAGENTGLEWSLEVEKPSMCSPKVLLPSGGAPSSGDSTHRYITDSLKHKVLLTQSSEDDRSNENAEITTIPSEMNGRRYFIDQRHFVKECIANSIDPSLDDYKYLNKRNWVVDGEQITLAGYIEARK